VILRNISSFTCVVYEGYKEMYRSTHGSEEQTFSPAAHSRLAVQDLHEKDIEATTASPEPCNDYNNALHLQSVHYKKLPAYFNNADIV
jgi:hypothetical protein